MKFERSKRPIIGYIQYLVVQNCTFFVQSRMYTLSRENSYGRHYLRLGPDKIWAEIYKKGTRDNNNNKMGIYKNGNILVYGVVSSGVLRFD